MLLGKSWKPQTNDPLPLEATKAILMVWPTTKIKLLGYSITRPILVLVAWTMKLVFARSGNTFKIVYLDPETDPDL